MESNSSLNNGRIGEQSNEQSNAPNLRADKSKEEEVPPEIPEVEEKYWLLHKYYTRHEFEKCKTLIEIEIEKWGGYTEYPHYLKGLILRREGKVQDSLDCFEKSYELNCHNVNNLMQIAKSHFLLGNHALAIEEYLKAEKMAPTPQWEIHHFLGECYIKENQLENARKHLIRATELINLDIPYMKLVKTYIMEDRTIEAIDIYKQAIEDLPESEQIAIELGLTYLELGDSKRAFQQFGTVLSSQPDNPKAIIPTGYVLQTHGEHDVAYNKYKVVAPSMPESWALWNNMGMCLFGKQKYVSAITCLKKAHYLNPLALEPACNLGMVFLATGQPASAAVHLCAAVASAPKSPMAYLLLGMALKRLEDLDGAECSLEKAYSLTPQDPLVLINYAVVLDAQQKQERARDMLVVLKDITALISVDDQIINMAKTLADKLQIDDKLFQPSVPIPETEQPRTWSDDEV